MDTPGEPTVAYGYDGPWLKTVTVGGPFTATIELAADRPQGGAATTNFWLGELTVNGQPSTRVSYAYDGDGLPTRIGEMELYYDGASGRWLGSHLGGTDSRVTRTSFGELARLEAGSSGGGPPPSVGEALLDVSYERDKVGRIVRKTETRRAGLGSAAATEVYDYTYDGDRGWLVEVKRDGVVVESYGYDANGNRTSWTTGFGSGTASYDAQDRLLTAGPLSFTYTDNGELQTKSQGGFTTTYTYDVFSNLVAVGLPDGVHVEYVVDGRNRRIGKKVGSALIQRFLYLGGLSPIAELDAGGQVTSQYVYGSRANVPDYLVRGGATYRLISDRLGSVRYVVNAATGEVVQRLDYDSFGRVTLDVLDDQE